MPAATGRWVARELPQPITRSPSCLTLAADLQGSPLLLVLPASLCVFVLCKMGPAHDSSSQPPIPPRFQVGLQRRPIYQVRPPRRLPPSLLASPLLPRSLRGLRPGDGWTPPSLGLVVCSSSSSSSGGVPLPALPARYAAGGALLLLLLCGRGPCLLVLLPLLDHGQHGAPYRRHGHHRLQAPPQGRYSTAQAAHIETTPQVPRLVGLTRWRPV